MAQIVIIPAEEDLKIESDGHVCTCGKRFQTSSQLQMHVTKHHQGKQLSARTANSLYYCPVNNCHRNIAGGKSFPRLGQLKQHYQRIHGIKDYVCSRCKKQFSLKDAYGRHLTECGKKFGCESCDEVFKTKNALYKHAQRKGHALPEGSKPKGKRAASQDTSLVLPIVVRQVVRLPSNLVSSSVQTDPEGSLPDQQSLSNPDTRPTSLHSNPDTRPTASPDTRPTGDPGTRPTSLHSNPDTRPTSLHSNPDTRPAALHSNPDTRPTSSSVLYHQHPPTFMENHLHTTFLDLSTQTEPHSSSLDHSFDLSDLATQTDFTGFFDFGTQTTSHLTSTQSCQTCLATVLEAPPGQAAAVASPESCDVQTYLEEDTLNSMELVEFGTQTAGELLGMATQTTPDFYHHHHQILTGLEHRIDFGTQTIDSLFSSVDELLDASCVELDSSSRPPGCIDFGVQAELSFSGDQELYNMLDQGNMHVRDQGHVGDHVTDHVTDEN